MSWQADFWNWPWLSYDKGRTKDYLVGDFVIPILITVPLFFWGCIAIKNDGGSGDMFFGTVLCLLTVGYWLDRFFDYMQQVP